MTNFFTNSMRLAKIVQNSIEKMTIISSKRYNRLDETKRSFFTQSIGILFKDSCESNKGKCPESSSSKDNDPCRSKTLNVKANACGKVSSMKNLSESRETRLEDISKISDPRCSNSQNVPIAATSKSPWDDPCPRDCKLSSTFDCSDLSSGKKKCPERPPIGCPPSEEDGKRMKFWRLLTLFGALPVILIARSIINVKLEEESKKPRPEYVPMEYMYRRTKRFPWGDGNHSLFHNPVKNAVPPHGYEVDDPNEVKEN